MYEYINTTPGGMLYYHKGRGECREYPKIQKGLLSSIHLPQVIHIRHTHTYNSIQAIHLHTLMSIAMVDNTPHPTGQTSFFLFYFSFFIDRSR